MVELLRGRCSDGGECWRGRCSDGGGVLAREM